MIFIFPVIKTAESIVGNIGSTAALGGLTYITCHSIALSSAVQLHSIYHLFSFKWFDSNLKDGCLH